MKVQHLLVKRARGSPLVPVRDFQFTPDGIVGGAQTQPLRQVLLLPTTTLHDFGLRPGDIRENIVVDFAGLHDLPSGAIICAEDARIRLTFHCEPCDRLSPYVNPRNILHKRGYLGSFLDSGQIRVGDFLSVSDDRRDPIPYGIKDRVCWFLEQRNCPVSARHLLWEVGLSTSYARALPRLLRSLSPKLGALVVFGSDRLAESSKSR